MNRIELSGSEAPLMQTHWERGGRHHRLEGPSLLLGQGPGLGNRGVSLWEFPSGDVCSQGRLLRGAMKICRCHICT